MKDLNFNIYAMSNPSTREEFSAMLVELKRVACELSSVIDHREEMIEGGLARLQDLPMSA